MSELKPCPFCGSENLAITYFGQPATAFHVKCRDCKALGPEIAIPRTPAGTICGQGNASLEWNRRTQPEATALAAEPVAWLSEQWGPSPDPTNYEGEWETVASVSNPTGWDGFRNPRPLVFAAPAQDLSAAILALPLPKPDGWNHSTEQMRDLLKAAAALASPAQALSAVDGEKQRIALIAAVQNYLVDVVRSFGDISCAAYISTWHKPETINAAIQAQKDGHG